MKLFFVAGFFIFPLSTTYSQEIDASGKILDELGSAVPFASIVFKSDTSEDKIFGVLSDEDGSFSIVLTKDSYN
ncbi:hypothetical protein [uncultured Maribacter sp.]|uniref:carboxypeptidase-like regulatory domain-containing protein n=1 Tax=uncultured Maribacter sp. TaxID=431308 RepID=UPI0030DB9FCD|tara:strand:- start:1358 stop:1579 length:222 start_codon:yes stop_codon:yes gene_type:complete